MPLMTAGQATVELVGAEGVPYIFGLPGYANLDIVDGFYGREDVRFIGVRHEQAAAIMADGYARATGGPGVCLATRGPGATNLVTGVALAYVSHSPVIALSGGTYLGEYYRDAFQELDLVNLFRPITKLSMQLNKVERIPELIRHAFRVATTGKNGPVFLEMPLDFLRGQSIDVEPEPPERHRLLRPSTEGDSESIQAASRLLLEAERPVVLVGGGAVWSGASDAAVTLADLVGAGLMTTYGHNDAVPNDHPRFLGALGRASSPEAAEAIKRADVLLGLGTRFPQMTTFFDDRFIQRHTRIIQVDVDPSEIRRNFPADVGIVGDAKAVAARLAGAMRPHIDEQTRNLAWQRDVESLVQRRRDRWETEARNSSIPATHDRVYAEMRRAVPDGTIFTVDAGMASAKAYDRLHFSESRTFFTPRNLGSLGVSYPLALGAKVARPEKTVISINGDGGFLFNAQEVQTAVDYDLNVVAVVMTNGTWGSEKAIQKHEYDGRYVSTDIHNPRYDRYAEAFGARGFYCEHPDQIGDALKEAIGCGEPAVVEILIDPEHLPPSSI